MGVHTTGPTIEMTRTDENKLIEEAKAAALKMGLEIDRENLHPLVQKAISELGALTESLTGLLCRSAIRSTWFRMIIGEP